MSRWRKVKQGKIEEKKSKKEKSDNSSNSMACAPIALRLKAFLTDSFMITMPILYIIIYLVMGSREGFREHLSTGWLYIVSIHMSIVVLLWKLKAQTPGMKAYDLYIVDPQDPDKKPGWIQCIIRYIMMQVSIVSFFGIFIPLFLKSKEALHDIISKTCIVHKPS